MKKRSRRNEGVNIWVMVVIAFVVTGLIYMYGSSGGDCGFLGNCL